MAEEAEAPDWYKRVWKRLDDIVASVACPVAETVLDKLNAEAVKAIKEEVPDMEGMRLALGLWEYRRGLLEGLLKRCKDMREEREKEEGKAKEVQ